MIRRVIAFSATNRILVLLVVAVLCLVAVAVLGMIRLDAMPDLSDTQVIILSRWDRAPDLLEDQVTYPIVSALLGAPKVKAVRGFSDFGYSFVYVIFEDGTDLYWARSRVLEYLSKIQSSLPEGVRTELGPDATGVGWVYQYALVDRGGRHSIDELRAIQDWTLRFALQSVPGVAEIASFGGYVRQVQIVVDPNRLAAYGVPIGEVVAAVQASNNESGGRLIEWSGAEYMVRIRGYARTVEEFGAVVLRASPTGVPLRVRDVATVELGPESRRGTGDLDGQGDAVGGIVVMRHGENALNVIRRVQAKLSDLAASLPPGVEVVTTYDRSNLILRALDTLKHELVLEMIVVSLVILFFLWHFPSAIVPIVTIPISVLLSFIPLYLLGISVNIMTLAGIAISIGVLVDGAIVEVENAYNKLHLWELGGRKGDFHAVRLAALQEVGPSVFFSLLVIAVAFLPIFALVDQEGRLFGPLAWSKNLAMLLAALLAITLDPALRMLFARMDPFTFKPRFLARLASGLLVGTYHAEERHPVSRAIHRVYEPACRFVLKWPKAVIAAALAILALSLPLYFRLGSEFMPPLAEGSILYMPTTLPGISIGEAQRVLELQDRILAGFPEVERVHGKAGRAESATDPAPLSMFETTVVLKPESRVAGEGDLVFGLDARLPEADGAPVLARPDLLRGVDRRDERRARDPRLHQRLDDADQGAARHALDGGADAGGDQGPGARSRRDRARRPGGRGGDARRSRGAQRLRRARRRRLLPRHRAAPGAARPLWAAGRGAAGGARRGDRRRERHHDDRGPAALPGERALSTGAARRPRQAGADPRAGGLGSAGALSGSSPTSRSPTARR